MRHDWVVKADADAVFFPYRLLWKLAAQKVTAGGIYLENCKYVDYGYFGNLEVFSHDAFSTLVANAEDCKATQPSCEQWAKTHSCSSAWTTVSTRSGASPRA